MADSFGDGLRREVNKYWAETRQPEVDRGKAWTAWDYVKNPGNTINRAASELAVDVLDPSFYAINDPDAERSRILKAARSKKDDATAQNTWDLLSKQGTLQGY